MSDPKDWLAQAAGHQQEADKDATEVRPASLND